MQSDFAGDVDHEHDVAQRAPAGLQQQRGVEHDRRLACGRELIAEFTQPLANSRVEQLFQEFAVGPARIGIRERTLGDRGAIDRAIGEQNSTAPTAHQCLADLLVFGEDFMAGAIGIEQAGSQFDKHSGDKRLAAGDAAN